jgi:serine/threonine protein kinase
MTYTGVSGRKWVIDETKQAAPGGRSTPYYGHEMDDELHRVWAQRAIGGDTEGLDLDRDREHLRRAYRIGRIEAVAACAHIHALIDLIDGYDVWTISECAETVLDHELRGGPLETDEVDQLELALTSALHVLHGEGLVHCDVREDNVLRFDGSWKLGDLGGVVRRYEPIEAIQKDPEYRRSGAELGALAVPENDHFALAVVLDHARNGLPPSSPCS